MFSLHISDVGRKNWKVPLGGENWWDLQKTFSDNQWLHRHGEICVCERRVDTVFVCVCVWPQTFLSVFCLQVRRFFRPCAAAALPVWRSWRRRSRSSPKRTVGVFLYFLYSFRMLKSWFCLLTNALLHIFIIILKLCFFFVLFLRWQLAEHHSSGSGADAAGEEQWSGSCQRPELQPTDEVAGQTCVGQEGGGEGGWGGERQQLQPGSRQSGDEELPQCHVVTRGRWTALVRLFRNCFWMSPRLGEVFLTLHVSVLLQEQLLSSIQPGAWRHGRCSGQTAGFVRRCGGKKNSTHVQRVFGKILCLYSLL